MNREEVDRLGANEETDALVAEYIGYNIVRPTMEESAMVMGCRVCSGVYVDTGMKSEWGKIVRDVPKYSRDVLAAMNVLEGMHRYEIERLHNGFCFVRTWVNEYAGAKKGEANTLPLAICRSVLLWHDKE